MPAAATKAATAASRAAQAVANRTRQAASSGDRGSVRLPGKPGPNPAGEGPHNITINEVASSVSDGRVIAGGGMSREAVRPTPGGMLGSRRPDIWVEKPDGSQYGINIGLQSNRTGAPITREVQAIDDLETFGGLPMHFVAYNKR